MTPWLGTVLQATGAPRNVRPYGHQSASVPPNALDRESSNPAFLLSDSFRRRQVSANRHTGAMAKPKKLSVAKLRRLYTLEEARSIKGPFVYGLTDDVGVFYVGKTIDAENRFYAYLPHRRRKLAPRLQRRLRDALGEVMVTILEHNPVNLDYAERRWIGELGAQLINAQGSFRHMTAKLPQKQKSRALAAQMARCAICGSTGVEDSGYHACLNDLTEIINPLANSAMQMVLIMGGINRPGQVFSLPQRIADPPNSDDP